jgi:predicted phosphoribosyltransferase
MVPPHQRHPIFRDRGDAGRRLAEQLIGMKLTNAIVYALPRGGVPVAVEIAAALKAPLDLLLVRKLGAPGQPELALGAVVDGDEAETVINADVAALTGADAAFSDRARRRELDEIERRRELYCGTMPRISPVGRTAIVVDDGLATGASAKAALRWLRHHGVLRSVLAIPVAPAETLAQMRAEADDVVCIATPRRFRSVGEFYRDFHQLSDEETVAYVRAARHGDAARDGE